ncbi:ATPase assembly factor ATP10 [Hygrophoropsis aurantiaca]|uniref:ATPase assembly factor ATP10 n=1 Tax=Hygrophoropsis aurantiaca TaxID=72124 RepID=A0ACB8AAH8_9AGAM|nr:ATPase assembly factor ATP10 [Hygrophoropsis aurantiaca]
MSLRLSLQRSLAIPRLQGRNRHQKYYATNKSDPPKLAEDDEHLDEIPLPLLQRPLGVQDKPKASIKTWADTKEELMDQKTRLEQRKSLVKEATKGYFTDLNATRRHGGKTWIAPTAMIREDKALYFPNVVGSALDTKQKRHTTDICQGRISVISMLNTRMSEIHVNGFVSPTNARFLSHPLYRYVQINLQENLLKSFLVSLFLSSIAKAVPPELHSTYLVSSQSMDYVREQLGMVNKHIGYVYLVDENLKIRWAGCADAKVEETNALERSTAALLSRISKK